MEIKFFDPRLGNQPLGIAIQHQLQSYWDEGEDEGEEEKDTDAEDVHVEGEGDGAGAGIAQQ